MSESYIKFLINFVIVFVAGSFIILQQKEIKAKDVELALKETQISLLTTEIKNQNDSISRLEEANKKARMKEVEIGEKIIRLKKEQGKEIEEINNLVKQSNIIDCPSALKALKEYGSKK